MPDLQNLLDQKGGVRVEPVSEAIWGEFSESGLPARVLYWGML